MTVIKRTAQGQLTDKSAENEFNNIIRQVPHKDDVLTKTGLTATIVFYAGIQVNTVTIVNGQIISWTQT